MQKHCKKQGTAEVTGRERWKEKANIPSSCPVDSKNLPNHPNAGGMAPSNTPARPPLGKEKGDLLALMLLLLLLWEGGEGSRGTILTLLFFLLL